MPLRDVVLGPLEITRAEHQPPDAVAYVFRRAIYVIHRCPHCRAENGKDATVCARCRKAL